MFPLHAGVEASVAATKSYIAQLVAGARVVAAWQDDLVLQSALSALPGVLSRAAAHMDWSVAVAALRDVDRLFVIGRGTGMPVALEAALKFKETCGIQAEAFSSAEVKHGPMALIEEGYPLWSSPRAGRRRQACWPWPTKCACAVPRCCWPHPAGTPGANLPLVETGAIDLDPIALIQSFYPMVEALARARGRNPDEPRFPGQGHQDPLMV